MPTPTNPKYLVTIIDLNMLTAEEQKFLTKDAVRYLSHLAPDCFDKATDAIDQVVEAGLASQRALEGEKV